MLSTQFLQKYVAQVLKLFISGVARKKGHCSIPPSFDKAQIEVYLKHSYRLVVGNLWAAAQLYAFYQFFLGRGLFGFTKFLWAAC